MLSLVKGGATRRGPLRHGPPPITGLSLYRCAARPNGLNVYKKAAFPRAAPFLPPLNSLQPIHSPCAKPTKPNHLATEPTMSKLAQILILAVGLGSLANAATWGTCFPLPGCVATSRAHPPHDVTWIGPKQTSISGECASFRRVGAPLKDVTSICQSK